ncbi:uncharacterized protein [Littorina saxatilis]|uniref:uncharacterized protein n=1 Tax=Littorina saxatilis TaxID=31220 RepID=UPI0038B4AE84
MVRFFAVILVTLAVLQWPRVANTMSVRHRSVGDVMSLTSPPPFPPTTTYPETTTVTGCFNPKSPNHGQTVCVICVPFCDASTCTVTCDAGFTFRDGRREKKYVCNWLGNRWMSSIPARQDTCVADSSVPTSDPIG